MPRPSRAWSSAGPEASHREGESTFLSSLPAGGKGTTFVVSADGKNQVFDLASGAREEDPLTDVYLRKVLRPPNVRPRHGRLMTLRLS